MFVISETFFFLLIFINSLLLSMSFRRILFLCLRFLIAKCSLAVDEVVIIRQLLTQKDMARDALSNQT